MQHCEQVSGWPHMLVNIYFLEKYNVPQLEYNDLARHVVTESEGRNLTEDRHGTGSISSARHWQSR
jgi:hypothetical protein